jgi:hypothetical protein
MRSTIALVVALLLLWATPAQAQLSSGLLAFWELEETAGNTRVDAAGANDLADGTSTPNTTGKVGNAIDFEDVATDRLTIASTADLQFGDDDFTICGWFNVENIVAFAVALAKGPASGSYEYAVYNDLTRWHFFVSNDGTASGDIAANNHGNLAAAQWDFICAWHDKTANTINIQVDDGTADSAAWSTGINAGSSDFVLGAIGSGSYFDGFIDQLGIWSRVLSGAERTELYNSGNGRDYAYIAGAGGATTRSLGLLGVGQ